MVFQHKQDMQDLRDIGYAMELRNTEQQAEAQMEFQSLVDEIKNKVRRGASERSHCLSQYPEEFLAVYCNEVSCGKPRVYTYVCMYIEANNVYGTWGKSVHTYVCAYVCILKITTVLSPFQLSHVLV